MRLSGHSASATRKQSEQEVLMSYKNLKTRPSDPASSKDAPLKGSTTFSNSATSWGVSVQTREPVWETLHDQNRKKNAVQSRGKRTGTSKRIGEA